MKRNILHFVLLLLASAVVGTVLLLLVFCLPTTRMRHNAEKSIDAMIKADDEISEDAFSQYLWKNRESYTDAIMVQNALEKLPEKSVLEHMVWMYHYDVNPDTWEPENSIKAFCASDGDTEGMYLHTYARYWHGYLVYLKPLLLLMSWEAVVYLELGVHIALMLLVLVTAIRKKHAGVAIVTLGSFLFMKPLLVTISLTMSVCWQITLIAVEILLVYGDRLREKKLYPEYFLMVGVATSYFDFLTYPVVTLGLPLCVFFLLEEGQTWKENFLRLIGYGASWSIGYAGMWASKWVIADLTLQTGTIKDGVWSIIGRTESIGGTPRWWGGPYTIGLNIAEYPTALIVLAGLLLLATVLVVFYLLYKKKLQHVGRALPALVGTACIPFGWIVVVMHHSALHSRFTFRILAVAVAAILTVAVLEARELSRK